MEDTSTSTGQRVSSRATKGVPPSRYGMPQSVASKKTRSKMSSSSKESVRQRKDAEAKRDADIVTIIQQLADKRKEKTTLDVSIRQITRQINKLKISEANSDAIQQLEDEMASLQDQVDILEAEISSMESTQKAQLQAVNSKHDAELARISSEEELSSSSSDEGERKMQRTLAWTVSQQVHLSDNESSKQASTVVKNSTFTVEQKKEELPHSNSTAYLPEKAPTDMLISRASSPTHSGYYSEPSLVDRRVPHQTVPIEGKSEMFAKSPVYSSGVYFHNETDGNRRPAHDSEHQKQEAPFTYHHNPPVSCHQPQGGPQGNDMVSQLVTALGQAFGNQRNEVVVKAPVDKNLPKFDGNPGDWENFRSEYCRTTQKYRYEDSENLTRLRSSLSGDALNAVKHLLANSANIAKIWETLEKRFGRPEFVLDYLVEKAKATKQPDPSKPETMVEFGTAIDALVTNICAYNQFDYMCNRQLINEFVAKLPPTLRTQWHEWLIDDPHRKPTLEFFSKWMTRKTDAAVMAMKPKITAEPLGVDERKRGRNRGHGSVNATPGNSEDKPRRSCPLCGKKNHPLAKCWQFSKLTVQDRWNAVKKNKCCISCLETGHRSKECSDSSKCPKDGCERWHHILLHSEEIKRSENKPTEKEEADREPLSVSGVESKTPGIINAAVIQGVDGPMRIVPVALKRNNGKGNILTFALMDSGATKSLILKSLSEELGLEGEDIGSYKYSGIGTTKTTVHNAKKVKCQAAGTFAGAPYTTLQNCVTVEEIRMTPYSFNLDEAKRIWPHLRKVKGENLVKVVPSLIIGNNNPEVQLPNRVVRGGLGDPVGLRTALGWVVAGDFEVEAGHGAINAISCGEEATDDYFHDMMKAWFTTESFGVKVSTQKGETREEKRAWQILEATTRRVDGRWETGLLWREDNVQLPDGERDALRRLEYTEKKMKADAVFQQKYMDKIAEYLEKGYLKKLTQEEAAARPPHTRYIPHFGQINPNKPDKFRFILDAKSKSQGTSLNEKLLKGPELIHPLNTVLMNFRRHAIALTGDISDMYHRIFIREEDQCSQRILWRDGDSSKDPDHYQMKVMFFGSTSSQASAIYVKDRNADDFKDLYPLTTAIVKSDFYSDDLLTGGRTMEEVIKIRQEISEIHAAGGFILCKFMSNSKEVLASISEELKATGVKGIKEKEEIPSERVLGLWWDPNEDIFTFKLCLHKVKQRVLDGEIPTKREMCGLVMSLYDPLGFISQYRVKGLMLLQEVWRCGTGWDDEIPIEINERWQRWLSTLNGITHVKVPRCYSTLLDGAEEVQLHTLQDASEEAFSAICYLRIRKGTAVEVALVAAKSRVAPLKKLTIPKLELQAAVMGTRMAATICKELQVPISSRWFWSDSKTVLYWIRSTAVRYKEFVANRIGEIQEETNASEWHWIPTKMNVADQATRFDSKISMEPTSEWYTGPSFLYGEPSGFPKENSENAIIAAVAGDLEDDSKQNNGFCENEKTPPVLIPSPERFSSYVRLLRATARANKCAHFWLSRYRKREEEIDVTTDDVLMAEIMLIKYAQGEAYGEEIANLLAGQPPSKKSAIWRLSPFVDRHGVLRIGGRIGASTVTEETKFPAILPSKHYITLLIIDYEHRKFAHQGVETVLASLRQKFWIPEGRKAVKRSGTRCQLCKLRRVKPIPPLMGCLPSFRLASRQPAFTYTGLDFFGPMTVTVGRRHEKRWGALFCCEVMRAVHLEICHGLSTDEVMLAISRFVDARGRPSQIISDNGTNFVGAAKELKEGLQNVDFERIKALGKFHEIKWTFNPPAAPHMGGSWERLIQSVKKCLSVVLREKYPKDTTLLTLMKAVENIINSRPLTHVSSDPADPQPITPNHLLRGGVDVGPGIPAKIEAHDEFLRAQWRRAELLAEQFWTRWTKEFLPKLMLRNKWNTPVQPLRVGDLVYLVDDNLPRNCWVRGYVSKVFPGADGQVRVVEITTRDFATKKKTVYKRPATKLCPLGLRIEIQDPSVTLDLGPEMLLSRVAPSRQRNF